MALACGPDLLIADEPTTALDVTIQKQILDLIQGLVAERGMALILISHDLGVIAQSVSKMLVMYGGSVVESGPTAAVFAERAHPYTQGLFAARPGAGRAARRAARHHPRQRARAGRPAAGLPLRGPLPLHGRRLPRHAPAADADARTATQVRCIRLDEVRPRTDEEFACMTRTSARSQRPGAPLHACRASGCSARRRRSRRSTA